MHEVVLNLGAIAIAAERIGIAGEAALVAHLGIQLSPVSLKLVSAVVSRLPITMAAAFSIVDRASIGEYRDLVSIARL